MRIRALRPACVLLLCSATPAAAQPYFTAQLGYGSADLSLGEPYNGVVDDRSIMGGVTGGVGFGRRWAIEGGVTIFGGFDGRATPCPSGQLCTQVIEPIGDNDMTLYHVAFVPRVSIGDWRLYAKAGYYHAQIDTEIELANDDFTENGVLLGAGVRWYVSEPWSVSLEASRLDDHVYQLGVGIGWGIGQLD